MIRGQGGEIEIFTYHYIHFYSFWTLYYVSVLWIQNALNELTKEISKTQNTFKTIFMIIVMVESFYVNSQELYMLINFYICVEERLHFI